ncbi:MAG: hypothetical protein AVDCRST_MAG29-1690 [uncultured Nocardioidaceae bacterium]|uniref:Uncharacterized protein n=1 Tax=uncultured Nocardioidaceae bacterium TaxID=253824 RepID=A0A6J4LWG0_9ACTN|nr:MAG: hypothetical protein AVDCRST_MAG29-1690 [uncultured Nocardioidaceae bacterium]
MIRSWSPGRSRTVLQRTLSSLVLSVGTDWVASRQPTMAPPTTSTTRTASVIGVLAPAMGTPLRRSCLGSSPAVHRSR